MHSYIISLKNVEKINEGFLILLLMKLKNISKFYINFMCVCIACTKWTEGSNSSLYMIIQKY